MDTSAKGIADRI